MKTARDVELTIDAEFQALLPAHSDQEAEHLKAKVEQQGFFDGTILYWPSNGKNIVIDGHHRNALWESLPDKTPIPPPRVEAVNLPDRDAAKNYMLQHQLARRNLDPKHASMLRGRLCQLEESIDASADAAKAPSLSQNGKNSRTSRPREGRPTSAKRQAAQRVAAKTGVSANTVERDAEFVSALDAIGKVNPKAKSDIESGQLKLAKKTIVSISKLGDQIGKALGNLRNGREWNDGITNGHAPKIKPSKGREITPAKVIDKIVTAHVSPLVRAIDEVAEINGGKGDCHRAASQCLDDLIDVLDKMREGQK
jgi:hypothetical protein